MVNLFDDLAYEHLHTELSVCIDSDDMMTKEGIEKILSFWSKNKLHRDMKINKIDLTSFVL